MSGRWRYFSRQVEAVAHEPAVADGEADVVDEVAHSSRASLADEEGADAHAGRLPPGDVVAQEAQRLAAIDDVLDDDDVPAAEVAARAAGRLLPFRRRSVPLRP